MARRWLLSGAAWERLLAPPADEREMLRHYVLGPDDLALVRARRTDATRLGFALQLLYLRHPGRVLGAGEMPPAPLVAFVARQIGVRRTAFAAYGHRDATRRRCAPPSTTRARATCWSPGSSIGSGAACST